MAKLIAVHIAGMTLATLATYIENTNFGFAFAVSTVLEVMAGLAVIEQINIVFSRPKAPSSTQ